METPEVDLQRKQEIAELEHERFVDLMHPYFGLDRHPGYFEIKVRPLLVSGIWGRSVICLSDSTDVEDLCYSTWHESAHLLHFRKNPYVADEVIKSKRFGKKIILAEMVAELGSLIFLDITEGLNSKAIKKYSIEPEMNSALDPLDIDVMIRIAKQDKGLLEKLVKSCNPNRAVRLVRSYQ